MKVMHMTAAGEDRRVEMKADYTPAADILTSCRNNSNVRFERTPG